MSSLGSLGHFVSLMRLRGRVGLVLGSSSCRKWVTGERLRFPTDGGEHHSGGDGEGADEHADSSHPGASSRRGDGDSDHELAAACALFLVSGDKLSSGCGDSESAASLGVRFFESDDEESLGCRVRNVGDAGGEAEVHSVPSTAASNADGAAVTETDYVDDGGGHVHGQDDYAVSDANGTEVRILIARYYALLFGVEFYVDDDDEGYATPESDLEVLGMLRTAAASRGFICE